MAMTEFQKLQMMDVIEPVRELVMNGTLRVTAENKLVPNESILPSVWIRSVHGAERACTLWTLWQNYYRFIPKGCRDCWKLTFSPTTLKEVYATEKVQKELGIPAKVGMETRSWTGNVGGYSAFWYCPLGCGLEEARGMHAKVKGALTKELKHSVDLILKRGCTEFERLMGPSDTWDRLAEERGWDALEGLLTEVYEPQVLVEVPQILDINVKLRMIYFAHEHGDATYKEFVGVDQLPPLTRYERSIHSVKDYPKGDDDGTDNNGSDNAEGASDSGQAGPELTLL